MAVKTTEPTYIYVLLRPIVFDRIIMDAKLAAGPAIRSTKPTPGVRPLAIRDKAMGIEPVAHIYIGTDTTTMTSMASKGY